MLVSYVFIMLYYENKAKKLGFNLVAGVDEVGRGPLAGPVVASAVILNKKKFQNRIDDSKKLTADQRQKAFKEILDNSFVGVGIINEKVIDNINIHQATQMAMEQAISELARRLKLRKKNFKNISKKICVLIDGNFFSKKIPFNFVNIIKGDAKSKSIASASIVAKVIRDRIMNIYDKVYPDYGFKNHKGYGTKAHLSALEKFGPSIIHRRSFSPLKCPHETLN